MKRLFADTGYWIALTFPNDALHNAAVSQAAQAKSIPIVTSEMVLTEYLDGVAELGPHIRQRAHLFVTDLRKLAQIQVVPQSTDMFMRAMDLYAARLDKEWTLTDCSSFVICSEFEIVEVLAHDHHFTQAGFTILL
jgi:predicted nucleic acid-binding protein